jgi:CRP-like cAMP-binding protein
MCYIAIATMLHPDKIHFYLKVFPHLSFDDLQQIFGIATLRTLQAGELYIREGDLTTTIAYIQEGLIRSYHINEKGEELTLLLRWEDQFIASHDNIFFQQPSRFVYQALEQTTLLEANYDRIESIMKNNPGYEASRHYFVLNMLAASILRVESFVLLSPEQRYLQLIEEKPNLVQRVPGKYLASLLGITPVSLSRIRKRIAVKQKH